jgi:Holliday junction DNA helicase RuvB
LEPGSVFFIDEVHRLGHAIEETLYPAMEERRLPAVLGQGAGARTVTLDLPPFTLVAPPRERGS